MARMGEFELLRRVRERLPPADGVVILGPGDDAAVTAPRGATATSVDAQVDGVHFRRDAASPGQIGGKAVAAALSDLAAMGAAPGEAYVALGVPSDMDEDECLALLEGAAAVAAANGTALAGGDLTRAPALLVSVTVVGHAPTAERLVTRAGARPGDVLVLTGELGGAAAGLLAQERPGAAAALDPGAREALLRRQLSPEPRLPAGAALAEAGATAMIDVSDGLGGDARHVAEASGVALRIEADAVPVAAGVAEVAAAAGLDPLRLALGGGEDYELLAALPAAAVDEAGLSARAGVAVTRVGEVTEGAGVEIRLRREGRTLEPEGYDQLGG